MARFQFRLKTFLAIRHSALDEARGQLAESHAQERAMKLQQAALDEELNELVQRARSGTAPGPVDVDRLLAANRYQLVLRGELHALAQRQQALAVEIEQRRQAAVVADREVQVMEKLRERQQEAFRQQQALIEVKQLDEVAARVTQTEESW